MHHALVLPACLEIQQNFTSKHPGNPLLMYLSVLSGMKAFSLLADEIRELRERERELGIIPDVDIDAFMKASNLQNKKQHIMTDYILRLLGLEVGSQQLCTPMVHLQSVCMLDSERCLGLAEASTKWLECLVSCRLKP